MEQVLITGGAGYFGSVLTDKLLQAGYSVHVLDALRYGEAGVLPYLHDKNYHLWNGSILDDELLRIIFDKSAISRVVHLAALVGEPLCDKYDAEARQVNLEGTNRLLKLGSKRRVSQFIFASTCSVYGSSHREITEEGALHPNSLYAETKVQAEKSVSQFPESTVLRFATFFGPSPRMRLDIMVNEFVSKALAERVIELYEPVDAWRPLLHVRDAADAVLKCLRSKDLVKGELLNVGGTNQNYTKRDLAESIQASLPGVEVKITKTTKDKRNYRVSFERIKEVLDFTPKTPLLIGIKEIIEDLQSRNQGDPIYDNVAGYNPNSLQKVAT